MATRPENLAFVRRKLNEWVTSPDDSWIAIYRLLLTYAHEVPCITDANRLTHASWRSRAMMVEQALSQAMDIPAEDVRTYLDVLMTSGLYAPGTQSQNPKGIAFAAAVVHLIDSAAPKRYNFIIEAKLGRDIFPGLTNFRRKGVDIVVLHQDKPFAAISSKWGMRHDRIRDPQEESVAYKEQIPNLNFFVTTNEFDNGRLQQLLTYPTIDGVFHIRKDLVMRAYGDRPPLGLDKLKDLSELLEFFTTSFPDSYDPANGRIQFGNSYVQPSFDL